MRLLYIWIDKYNSLEDVEVNFTDEHKFSYDKESGVITYERKEGILNNFYYDKASPGRFVGIHAIVGDNGVGKSSILKLIIENIVSIKNCTAKLLFAILDDDKKIKIFCKGYKEESYNFEVKGLNNAKVEIYNEDVIRCLYNTMFIYYTSLFEENIYFTGVCNFRDLSPYYLYEPHADKDMVDPQYYSEFFYREFLQQINFVYKYDSEKYVPFQLPEKVILTLRNVRGDLEQLKEYEVPRAIYSKLSKRKDDFIIDFCILLNDKIQDIEFERDNDFLKKSFIIQIIISFIFNCYKKGLKKELYSFILKELRTTKENLDKALIEKLINEIFYEYEYTVFLKDIEDCFTALKQNNLLFDNEFYELYIMLKDLYKEKCEFGYSALILYVNDNKNTFKEFYLKYEKTARGFNYINFSWGLSSGENNFLNLMSRFYTIIENGEYENRLSQINESDNYEDDQIKSMIILIDEGENAFHPKWQQRYIKALTNFLKDLYKGVSIQIILTTHSPIILSDMIGDNVTYLKKEEIGGKTIMYENDKKTFAANIYDLYNDAFFLNDSNYGIIGKYAQKRIEETEVELSNLYEHLRSIDKFLVKKNINNESKRDKFHTMVDKEMINKLPGCKAVIDVLGEKVIAYSLKQKYDYIMKIISKYEQKDNKDLTSNSNVSRMIENYSNLSKEEKKSFIKYLISDN